MLSVQQVTKCYGPLRALDSFTADIPDGQLVGLLGQNGAGKTTLMNLLTGNLASSGGTILINGFDILTQAEQARQQIGYLPERVPLYDEMTVREYMLFLCRLRRVVPADRKRHVEDIAHLTGIAPVLSRRIGNLSRGFRQRVGLAQALCGDPEILILDEPTVGLDPAQAAEFRQLLSTLHRDHTILLSSHILSDVENICDRVLIIHHGRLVRDLSLSAEDERLLRLNAMMACGKDQLLPRLKKLPGVREVTALKNEEPGITHALMTFSPDTPAERELFRLACELDAPILRLYREKNSLEEIFLEAIKE